MSLLRPSISNPIRAARARISIPISIPIQPGRPFHHIHHPHHHSHPSRPSNLSLRLLSSHPPSRTLSSRSPSNPNPTPKPYTFTQISTLTKSSPKSTLIIDVRSHPELASTGRIPGAQHIPLNENPDFASLDEGEFAGRFGFAKPRGDEVKPGVERGEGEREGEGVDVVFYCKAGVRSYAAAVLAMRAGWGTVGSYAGSWDEWVAKGGRVERG